MGFYVHPPGGGSFDGREWGIRSGTTIFFMRGLGTSQGGGGRAQEGKNARIPAPIDFFGLEGTLLTVEGKAHTAVTSLFV